MGRSFLYFLALLAAWCLPLKGLAQSSQSDTSAAGALNPLDLNAVPARPAALGGAFTGLSDDASSLLFNPAGLAWLSGQEAVLFGDAGWAGSFKGSVLYAFPQGEGLGFGFSGSYLGYGPFEGFDDSGAPASGYSGDRFLLQAGGAWAPGPKVSLGASLRLSQQSLPGYDLTFLTPDLGVLYEPVEGLRVGADFALPVLSPSGFPAVPSLRAGASWRTSLDQDTRLLFLGGITHGAGSADWVQAGLEAGYRSSYFLRAGYQRTLTSNAYRSFSEFTFGAGVALGGLRLDYAFLPSGDLGNSHRFSTSFRWGSEKGSAGGKIEAPKPGPEAGNEAKDGLKGKTENDGASSEAKDGEGVNGKDPEVEPALLPAPLLKDPVRESVLPTPLPTPGLGEEDGKDRKEGLVLEFDIPPDFVAQGEALEGEGKYGEAAVSYEKAIAQDGRNVQAWWKLGQLHARQGRKAEAVRCVEEALKIRPDQKALKDWLQKHKGK